MAECVAHRAIDLTSEARETTIYGASLKECLPAKADAKKISEQAGAFSNLREF
jgi:hypothetical protein